MKEAIEVNQQGVKLYIETDTDRLITTGPAVTDGALHGAGVDAALNKLKEIGSSIALVCDSIQSELNARLERARPDEMSLEFGIKLTGEAGVPMLTKASGEAGFKVTAKWSRPKGQGA